MGLTLAALGVFLNLVEWVRGTFIILLMSLVLILSAIGQVLNREPK